MHRAVNVHYVGIEDIRKNRFLLLYITLQFQLLTSSHSPTHKSYLFPVHEIIVLNVLIHCTFYQQLRMFYDVSGTKCFKNKIKQSPQPSSNLGSIRKSKWSNMLLFIIFKIVLLLKTTVMI